MLLKLEMFSQKQKHKSNTPMSPIERMRYAILKYFGNIKTNKNAHSIESEIQSLLYLNI